MTDDVLNRLESVYGAKDRAALDREYAAWAEQYDRDVMALGYTPHSLVAGMAARYLAPGEGPLLDCGAGTGLVAVLLRAFGLRDLVALDMSEAMLSVARSRGVYRACVQGVLGERLPFDDASFVAVVGAGTFTAGHAPGDSFHEMTRVLRPGGVLVVGLRGDGDHAARYLDCLTALTEAGKLAHLADSDPCPAFLLSPEEAHVLTVVKVYRRTGD